MKKILKTKKIIIPLVLTFIVLLAVGAFIAGIASGKLVKETAEYKEANQKVSELEAELQKVQIEKESLGSSEQSEIEITNIDIEVASNGEKINQLNTDITNLDAQINAKSGEVYDAKINYNDNVVTKMIIERGSEAIALYGITKTLAQVEADIAATGAIYTQKQNEYSALVAEKDAKIAEKQALEAKHPELQQKKDTLIKAMEDNAIKINELETSLNELNEQISYAREDITNSTHWTQKLEAKINNIL